jgi:serine/threonine protein kinase
MTPDLRLDDAARVRRVTRRLETRGLPGLGEALARLRGSPIGGGWRIDTLYAVGAEGAVFTTSDDGTTGAPPTVVKIPLLPYHRPADISSAMLRHRRAALREEARYLARSASPYMPRDCGLHEFINPLLESGRGGPFEETDPALVMERLPGLDVDLWLARIHRSGLSRTILRERLDAIAVMLLDALRDLEMRGFFYADLRPGNLRVTGRPLRRLRLLDAGSLVEVGDTSGRYPHVPHYLPPDLFERRYMSGLPIVPSAAAQAVMAGRTLYEIVTGCVPMPGRPLDVSDLRNSCVSPVIADAIDGLGAGSFSSVVSTLKYIARNRSRQSVGVPANGIAAAPAVPPLRSDAPVTEVPAPIAARLAASAARPAPEPPGPREPRAAAESAAPPATPSAHEPPRGFWQRLLDRAAPWRRRRDEVAT